MRLLDLLAFSLMQISRRPIRALSRGLGIALGSAVFVVAVGVGQMASAQVSSCFDAFRVTTVSTRLVSQLKHHVLTARQCSLIRASILLAT